jgi:hypothetical protein
MRSSEIFGEAEKFLNFRMSRVVRGSERSGEACAARACPKNVVQDAERSGVSWTTVSAAAAPQRKCLQLQLPSINSSFPQKQITIVGLPVCTLLGVRLILPVSAVINP